jgi:ADP-heptose:LPS heptosyltransferase
VVQALSRLLPEAHIRVYTDPVAAPLYGGRSNVTPVPLARKLLKPNWSAPGVVLSHLGDVRRFRPDLCLTSYDVPSLLNVICNLSGARAIVGQENKAQKIKPRYTRMVPLNGEEAISLQNWRTLPAVLEQLRVAPREDMTSAPPPPDLEHMMTRKPSRRPGRVVIHPGGSLPVKRWFLERYRELATKLSGSPALEVCWIEHDIKLEEELPGNIRKITPGSLGELCELLASANLFIGNNSGPMHFACSLGTPSLILSGPSLRTWDPLWFQDRIRLLRHPELPCLPCDVIGRQTLACKNLDHPMACMDYWTVDKVAEICHELLQKWPAQECAFS